jgi:hypothetical protein
MKNFNTERIEIILIIAGAFLGAYIFMIGFMGVMHGLYAYING